MTGQKRRKPHRKGGNTPPEAESGQVAPASSGDEPHRRCIVSGAVQTKDRLMRFVVGPGDVVVPDLDECLPGRGLWLSASHDMVQTAIAKRSFSRAARRPLTVPPDLAERIGGMLRQRCLGLLGMARRAGLVVAGYDKVHGAAKAGPLDMVFAAQDGAADGRAKIRSVARGARLVEEFTAAELASVLGRDHVVHVAVSTHGKTGQRPLVARLAQALNRLAAWDGQTVEENPDPGMPDRDGSAPDGAGTE